jgi:hypothetical protein
LGRSLWWGVNAYVPRSFVRPFFGVHGRFYGFFFCHPKKQKTKNKKTKTKTKTEEKKTTSQAVTYPNFPLLKRKTLDLPA